VTGAEETAADSGAPAPPRWPTRSEHARWRRAELFAYAGVGLAVARANVGKPIGIVEETLRYGGDIDQRIVLVRPADAAGVRGLAVFVHGGSWKSGSPERYRFAGRWFAKRGYAAGVVGYRHVPEHVFPAQLADILCAWALLRELAPRFGASADGAIIAGQSAGAHLAALAVYGAAARAAGIPDEATCAVALVSGPLDLGVLCPRKEFCPLIGELMGGDAGWDVADPVLQVGAGDTWPLLVIHGAKDPLVNVAGSASFADKARQQGAPVTLDVVPEGHHVDLVRVFVDGDSASRTLEGFVAGPASGRAVPAT